MLPFFVFTEKNDSLALGLVMTGSELRLTAGTNGLYFPPDSSLLLLRDSFGDMKRALLFLDLGGEFTRPGSAA